VREWLHAYLNWHDAIQRDEDPGIPALVPPGHWRDIEILGRIWIATRKGKKEGRLLLLGPEIANRMQEKDERIQRIPGRRPDAKEDLKALETAIKAAAQTMINAGLSKGEIDERLARKFKKSARTVRHYRIKA